MGSFKEDLILKEIEILQERIEDYDKHVLLIKGWAITIWSGIWLFIINQLISGIYFFLIVADLIGIFALLFFWAFDSLYKYYQRAFIVRTKQIEDNIEKRYDEITNNTKPTEKLILFNPTGIKSDAHRYLHKLWRCLLLRNVSVFYLTLIGISFFGMSLIANQKNPNSIIGFNLGIILGIISSFLSFILLICGHDKTFSYIANKFKGKEKKDIKISIQQSTLNKLTKIKKEKTESYDKIINDLISDAESISKKNSI